MSHLPSPPYIALAPLRSEDFCVANLGLVRGYHPIISPLCSSTSPLGGSFLALTPSDTRQIPPRPEQHRFSVPLGPNSSAGCPGCNADWRGELHKHLSKFVQCSWTRGVCAGLQAAFLGAAPALSVLRMAP